MAHLQLIEDETVFAKKANSAFIGTELEGLLRLRRVPDVVIAGLTTPHCVSTTTRMSGNLGFNTYLISDAAAAFELAGLDGRRYSAAEVHELTLAALHREFAEVTTAEQLLIRFNGAADRQRSAMDG